MSHHEFSIAEEIAARRAARVAGTSVRHGTIGTAEESRWSVRRYALLIALVAFAAFAFASRNCARILAHEIHPGRLFNASDISRTGNSVLTVPAGYHLTFSDDFKSLSISDTDGAGTKWYSNTVQCCMFDTSAPSTPTHMSGVRDQENQRPFLLGPDGLHIRLQKNNGAWYSGVLATVDRQGNGFSQRYGYFEMRAKFPGDAGTWPAFWLLNADALKAHAPTGEIDVVESYIFAPDYVNITLHDWTPPGKVLVHKVSKVANLSDGFHTFALLWTASEMTFACDGHVLTSVPTPSIMHQPYYPIIDLGLGGGWPTNRMPARSEMVVQYVKVWAQ